MEIILSNKSKNYKILSPILFFLLILTISTYIFGYKFGALFFFILFTLIISFKKNLFIKEKLLLINLFLLLFDNSDFQFFGDYRFRLWYFTSYLLALINFKSIFKVFYAKYSIYQLNFIIFYIIITIYHISFLFIEADKTANLYNLKYIFFYINTIFIFSMVQLINKFEFYRYLLIILNTICFFGIIQFSSNIAGLQDFQYFSENIRPAGFFSETNWYSLLCVITFFLNFKFRNFLSNRLLYLLLQLIITSGLLITVSRSGILSFLFLFFIYYFKNIKKIFSLTTISVLIFTIYFSFILD